MTRAKLFRAASFAEGTPNLLTLYTLTSGRLNREIHEFEYGANPYDSPQRYLDLSPELKFEGLHTASLFEAGAQASAINMLGYPKAAQHAGMPAEYIVYPRTLHNIRTPRLQRESAEINLDWFLFWLEDKENADPTKSEQYARWSALRSLKGAPPEDPLSPSRVVGAR
jgi:hypothetical protein